MSPKVKDILTHAAYWIAILSQLVESMLKSSGSN